MCIGTGDSRWGKPISRPLKDVVALTGVVLGRMDLPSGPLWHTQAQLVLGGAVTTIPRPPDGVPMH